MKQTPELERGYWNKAAQDPEVDINFMSSEASTDEFLEEILNGINKPKRILEIGCGVGRLLIPIAKRFPKSTVFGLDISEELTKIGEERGKEVSNIVWVTNYGGRNIGIEKLDFIYSVLVFQHLDEETIKGYIEQVKENLNQDGIFKFQFAEGGYHAMFNHNYSVEQVTGWVRDAGLAVINVEKAVHPQWVWITARQP